MKLEIIKIIYNGFQIVNPKISEIRNLYFIYESVNKIKKSLQQLQKNNLEKQKKNTK